MQDSKFVDDLKFAKDCLDNKNVSKFVKEHKALIKGLISKQLNSLEMSHLEDVYQEILISLFSKRGLEKYEGKSKLTTWLFIVIRNRTIDYIRKMNKHDDVISKVGVFGSINSKNPDSLENLVKKEKVMIIRKTLRVLQEEWDFEKTTMLKMRYLEELTYEQIARIFQKSLSAVPNYLREASKKFKKVYVRLNIDASGE